MDAGLSVGTGRDLGGDVELDSSPSMLSHSNTDSFTFLGLIQFPSVLPILG